MLLVTRKVALGVVALALLLQPIVACAAVVINDGDEALDFGFGDDPIEIAGGVVLPLLEPRADVVEPPPANVPPRVADPADHPPRLA